MTGRIEHWRRAYRVRGTRAAADRLDRLAGPALAAYEAALDRARGTSDEVLLVRGATARVVVTAGDEAGAARQWGEGMAAAVLRAIAAAAGSDDVVRFPDRAGHQAAFVAAVASGRPADDWFFARFAPLRRAGVADTVQAALLADPAACPAVLRRLAESGNLPCVLRVLGPAGTAEVWGALAGAAPPDADRPLFVAAVALLARLGATGVDADRAAAWFATFAADRTATDWCDPGALADAVADAVRFLLARVRLSSPPTPAECDRAVAPLDWLDTARLRADLADVFAAPPAALPSRRSQRPHRGPTPRQSAWLAAVRAALPRASPHLDRVHLRSPANAALLYATVLADHPEWAGDSTLSGFIDQLLAAAADPAGGPLLAVLGEAGARVTRELTGTQDRQDRPVRGPESAPVGTETVAAGVFLLLRAARDLRLPALANRSEFPAGGPAGGRLLLAALAAKWAGLGFGDDPAPALFAGRDAPGVAAFRAAWARAGDESAARFQGGLARVLLGHRLLSANDPFRVWVSDRPAGRVAVGGNEAGTVWPFAAPLGTGEDTELADRWRTAWETITGGAGVVAGPEPGPPAVSVAMDLFAQVPVGGPVGDLVLTATAQAAVRAWARWLGTFHDASTGYLLKLLVRRPGRVFTDDGGLLVELEPRPADVVLQAAGYLDPIEPPPGSDEVRVRFRWGG